MTDTGMIEAFRGEELEEKDTLTLTLSRRGRGKKSRERGKYQE